MPTARRAPATLYELSNETLRESILASSPLHAACPAAARAGWDPRRHEIAARVVESGMPAARLRAFADWYARSRRSLGWKVRRR